MERAEEIKVSPAGVWLTIPQKLLDSGQDTKDSSGGGGTASRKKGEENQDDSKEAENQKLKAGLQGTFTLILEGLFVLPRLRVLQFVQSVPYY